MLLDDRDESLLLLVGAHPYVRTGHPDFIAIGRVHVWIRHAESVVLNLPGSSPFPVHFVAKEDAVGPEIAHPMRAVGNVVADYSCADFLLAKHLNVSCACAVDTQIVAANRTVSGRSCGVRPFMTE